jgi:GNAT superfamily N-acetyltransferase
VHTHFTVRRGDAADTRVLLDLFDGAIRWMVQRGATEQWGSTPFSEIPERVNSIRTWAAGGGLRVAERDGRPAAAIVLGDAHPYVHAAREPELYVMVLIGSREPFARGAGRFLLQVAEQEASEQRLGLLRVDCFAGNGGALVRFYESCGFTRTETFTVRDWPGQVLERRLDKAASSA